MNMNVVLQDVLVGRSYPEAGYALFELAEKAIDNKEQVFLDMKGVESVPTLFMNTSFGDLILQHGIEKTKKLFTFNNVTKSQVERIQKYFNDFQTLIENNKKAAK